MLRLRALLLGALALTLVGAAPPPPAPYYHTYLGPSEILFADADTVMLLRSLEWHSANVRHQEKLLGHQLRMQYWRAHLPQDMRRVFDALGYPTGRLMLTPVGHTEEHWFYGPLARPLVFRDGVLQNVAPPGEALPR
ncbi:MAG TPA: hypothetical protein VID50_04340 [Candidatus Eisenbacteria bacterium]|jgi:hypothetical protein